MLAVVPDGLIFSVCTYIHQFLLKYGMECLRFYESEANDVHPNW